MTLKHLDLCAGIGGFSLGLENTGRFRTMAFCEIDTHCQAVLHKHWPTTPIFDDVKTLKANDLFCRPDIITSGYPCQPFSQAGHQKGTDDPRHIWPDIARIITETRPRLCIFENVEGHIRIGVDDVLDDLERLGYAHRLFLIPALAVDARHKRNRLFIIASESGYVLPACPTVRAGYSMPMVREWPAEPDGIPRHVGRGIKNRRGRVKALGNSVVPHLVNHIARAMTQREAAPAPQNELAENLKWHNARGGDNLMRVGQADDGLEAVKRGILNYVFRSTIADLKWGHKATPKGRPVYHLKAMIPRSTPDAQPTIWASPSASDGSGGAHLPTSALARGWRWGGDCWIKPDGYRKTASLRNQVAVWPSPRASDSKAAPKNRHTNSPTYKRNLSEAVRTSESSGQLNPEWIEWLMGYPLGFTDLT